MTRSTTFDLVANPWLPLRSLDGALRQVGLREALTDAHTFAAVEHPIPIVEAGVWRLLVALILDIFEPRSLDDLIGLTESSRFDAEHVTAYLARQREALDLFSPTRPFLQDSTAAGEEKPVAALLPSWPSGTNVVHWHHSHEDDLAVCPADAALLLTTIAPFMTAGGAGLAPSINGAPPWYVMIEGPTLFHSIALNLWVRHSSNTPRGVPAWRRTTALMRSARRTSATLLEAYTWQPRRIRLLPGAAGRCSLCGEESPGLVRRMYFGAGESCDFEWTDPNVAYIRTTEKRMPLRPQEGREPWRDVGSLALLQDRPEVSGEAARVLTRPAIVSQFAELSRNAREVVGDALRLRLYGMRTDLKMKVFEWVRQTLELPVPLVLREMLHTQLVHAVREAEQVQRALAGAVKRAMTSTPLGSRTEGGENVRPGSEALIRAASVGYWTSLEPYFRHLADRLGARGEDIPPEELDAAVAQWRSEVRRAARAAFGSASASLRLDADGLVAIEHGRSILEGALRRLGRPSPGPPPAGSARRQPRRAPRT